MQETNLRLVDLPERVSLFDIFNLSGDILTFGISNLNIFQQSHF